MPVCLAVPGGDRSVIMPVFIAVQGGDRSVIITPETTLNDVWIETAQKIIKFIEVSERGEKAAVIRQHQIKSSFIEAIRSNKRSTEAIKGSTPPIITCRMSLPGSSIVSEDDMLGRCIVGRYLDLSQDMPTLRRWVSCSLLTESMYMLWMTPGFWLSFHLGRKQSMSSMLIGDGRIQIVTRMVVCHAVDTGWRMWQEAGYGSVFMLCLWTCGRKPPSSRLERCVGVGLKQRKQLSKIICIGQELKLGEIVEFPRELEESDGCIFKLPIWCEILTMVGKRWSDLQFDIPA